MRKSKKKDFIKKIKTDGQLYNVILAARKRSDCPAAKGFVRKMDKRYGKKK